MNRRDTVCVLVHAGVSVCRVIDATVGVERSVTVVDRRPITTDIDAVRNVVILTDWRDRGAITGARNCLAGVDNCGNTENDDEQQRDREYAAALKLHRTTRTAPCELRRLFC